MPKREQKPLQKKVRTGGSSREAVESRCIAKAYALVEQRLEDGTATSQETVHFLRMGSTREQIEREHMRQKTEEAAAKVEMYERMKQNEIDMKEAMRAFTTYGRMFAPSEGKE